MEITKEIKEKIRAVIVEVIGNNAYDCTRDWSAWRYGTMDENDFIPIIDQAERLAEIADAVIVDPICHACGATGEIEEYFDAGDHFGGSPSPWSEWRKRPCPVCSGDNRQRQVRRLNW